MPSIPGDVCYNSVRPGDHAPFLDTHGNSGRIGRSAPGDQKVNANLIVKAPHKPSGVAGRATGAMPPKLFVNVFSPINLRCYIILVCKSGERWQVVRNGHGKLWMKGTHSMDISEVCHA